MAKINDGYGAPTQGKIQNTQKPIYPKPSTGPRMRMSRNMTQQKNRLADIPMRSLDIKHVPTIPVCDRSTLTKSQRFNQLYKLAESKIPDERKRNPTTLKMNSIKYAFWPGTRIFLCGG